MHAASTGGGLVCFVVIWLVVLAVLVMTAAGASSTSAAATATVTATVNTTAAVHSTTSTTSTTPRSTTSADDAAAAKRALAAEKNATAAADRKTACEVVRVSVRKPACSGQISEGPGPPPPLRLPPSRCPAATCAASRVDRSSDNNKNKNINNKDNVNNYDRNINNNSNINSNDNGNNNKNSNHQCLEYVRPELMPEMCPSDPIAYIRPGRLSRYRLRHCCHHTVESVVQRPYRDRSSCVERVNEAMRMDSVAAAMSCQFDEVLARYDCKQQYSAKTCDSCKDAYALWACSAVLPHWTTTGRTTTTTTTTTTRTTTTTTTTTTAVTTDATAASTAAKRGRRYRVNACRSVCLAAEQTCPWLLPVADDSNPYAGEAAFTCMDPDIGYQMSSTDARRDCCYEHCDDRLCVRNASMCVAGGDADVGPSDRGGGGAVYGDQRPVCLEDVPLSDDDFECFDFDDADSGGTRTTARTAVGLLAVAAVSWCLARTALSAAAVT